MTARRHLTLRTAAALAGGAAIAPMACLVGPTAAATTPAGSVSTNAVIVAADPAQPEAAVQADVALHTVTPTAIAPSDTMTLAGTVTNSGSEPLENPQALLRYSRMPLDSRAEIDQVFADPDFRTGRRPGAPFHELENLPPGQSVEFSLEVPVDDLGLSTAGVYVVGVDVNADDTSDDAATSRITVGADRTVVPYLTDDEPLPEVPVAAVWGLQTEPRITNDGSLTDDDLAAELGTDGRLGRLLRAGEQAPVTWLVDPDLLLTVEAMSTDYVVGTGDDATPGTGSFAAVGFWETFAAARDDAQILLGPLADPDIESFVETEPDLAERLVTTATTATDEVARRLADGTLSGPTDSDTNRPPDAEEPEAAAQNDEQNGDQNGDQTVDGGTGDDADNDAADDDADDDTAGKANMTAPHNDAVPAESTDISGPVVRVTDSSFDARALEVYAAAGVERVIVNASSVDPHPPTPFAEVATDSGPVEVVVSDPGLDAAFVDAAGHQEARAAGTRLAHRWRAETAMIALEAQRADRSPTPMVVAAPGGWSPSAETLEAAVAVWTDTPWIAASTLDDLERPARLPDIDLAAGTPVGALPLANVSATANLDTTARHFVTMLADPSAGGGDATRSLDLTVLRSASRSWRSDPASGLAYTTAVTNRLDADIRQVTLSVPEQVTLSSQTGVFPLTVDNPLDYAVSVRIAVNSANPDRLRVDSVTEQVVEGGTRATVNVEAQAFSNGRVPVDVGLVATDGTALGPERRTIVNATDYGAFGWIVVGAGALMLAWSIGRRAWRRRHPRPEAAAVLADMESGLEPDPSQQPDEAAAADLAARGGPNPSPRSHTGGEVSR